MLGLHTKQTIPTCLTRFINGLIRLYEHRQRLGLHVDARRVVEGQTTCSSDDERVRRLQQILWNLKTFGNK